MAELVVGNSFEMALSGFDGVITDPPYNKSTASNSPVEGRLGCPEFENASLFTLATKVTNDDAFMIVTSNFPNGAELHALSKETCWRWRGTQVWDKRPTRTWVSWSLPLKCLEYIHFFTRGKFKLSFKDGTVKPKVKRKSFGGKMKVGKPNENEFSYGMFQEIMSFPRLGKAERVHPTQKPKGMSEMFAKIVGEEKRVLDPFCGSGALISSFHNALGVDLKDWWSDVLAS